MPKIMSCARVLTPAQKLHRSEGAARRRARLRESLAAAGLAPKVPTPKERSDFLDRLIKAHTTRGVPL